jgi:hypothetical protein
MNIEAEIDMKTDTGISFIITRRSKAPLRFFHPYVGTQQADRPLADAAGRSNAIYEQQRSSRKIQQCMFL